MYYFLKLKFTQKMALIKQMQASPCDRQDSHRYKLSITILIQFPSLKCVYIFLAPSVCVCVYIYMCVCVCVYMYTLLVISLLCYWC